MIAYLAARLIVSILAAITGGQGQCYEDYSQCWVEHAGNRHAYVVTLDNSWWENAR